MIIKLDCGISEKDYVNFAKELIDYYMFYNNMFYNKYVQIDFPFRAPTTAFIDLKYENLKELAYSQIAKDYHLSLDSKRNILKVCRKIENKIGF